MKLLQKLSLDVMRGARAYGVVSFLLISATIGLLAFKGLNYGIDFNGGLLIEVKVKPDTTIKDLRQKLSTLKELDFSLQEFGTPEDILLRANLDKIPAAKAVEMVKNVIDSSVVEYRRTEFVGPVVGDELKESALFALLYSLLAIMIYIWLRFEWQYGVGALLALFHDVFITIGFVALMDIEFGLPVVAAILTIAGYSINDTVVIFDRVRENFARYSKRTYSEVYNLAINQSLTRTVITSFTTLLALLSLYFFGGAATQGFTIAMIFGVVIGTYSSNCVAVPFLLAFKPNRGGDDEFEDPIKKLQREQDQLNQQNKQKNA